MSIQNEYKHRTLRSPARYAAIAILSASAMSGVGHAQCGSFAAGKGEKSSICSGLLSERAVANAAVAELFDARNAGEVRSGEDQVNLVKKYLPLVDYDENDLPADPVDRAALGDLLFLNFMPAETEILFAGLMDRDDLLGRLAWQRVMQVRRQAFERTDEVKEMLKEYRKKYSYIKEDVYGSFQQVIAFAQADFQAGDSDKAMDRIMSETELAPADAPYRIFVAFKLLGEPIAESGREEEYKALLASKLKEFKALKKNWESTEVLADEELATRAQAPEWYWTFQRVGRAESISAARQRQLDELISDLTAYLGA